MADKTIGQLPRATTVQESDLFAIEQSGEAKGVSGYTLVADLAHYLNGRGGINNIEYTAPVSPSLTGTVTITLADGSTE